MAYRWNTFEITFNIYKESLEALLYKPITSIKFSDDSPFT